MEQFVITVGRQFGSMGRPIARETSELLGIEYYDRDIVEQTAQRLGLSKKEISKQEEEAAKRYGIFGKMLYPLGAGTTELQDKIFAVQAQILKDYAEKGSCILVGRCSDFVLRNHPNAIHIFIYAPLEDRVRNCVESLNMSGAAGRKMCINVDKSRLAYHQRYAGYAPTDHTHYDLMLNSSLLGIHGTARILAEIARQKFQLK